MPPLHRAGQRGAKNDRLQGDQSNLQRFYGDASLAGYFDHAFDMWSTGR